MRVVLDLLDQFTNTRVLSLFHIARDLARSLGRCPQRVSPFYHNLGLALVGLIGNFLTVEQLVPLVVVEQLLNPILSSSHVSRRSLEEDEVTHILSRI